MKFFRTRKEQQETKPDPSLQLTEEQRRELEHRVAELQQQLSSADDLAPVLDELGATYRSLGDIDAAIASFERSLDAKEIYGPAYTTLTELYNVKLREAAMHKDSDGIGLWTTKIDDHMARSKRIIRSNY